MAANRRKLERVARAICQAAGRYSGRDNGPGPACIQCSLYEAGDDGDPRWIVNTENCSMWDQFLAEAQAAIDAVKGV